MKKFYNFITSPNETELFLNGAIIGGDEKIDNTDVIFSDFKNALDSMSDNTTLKLHISSPGGDVMATQNIMCLLANAKSQKNITIESYISLGASCASWLPTISDKIYVYENNSMIMLHLPYTMMIGNRVDMEKEKELLTKIEDQMIGNYMSKTREGVTEEQIRNMLEAETWITGEEFVNLFDAELIPTTSKMVACSDMDILKKYKNVPEELKNIIDTNTVKNELSQEDVRDELRNQLVEKLGVDKYDVWISGSMVYDSYFIYELWNSVSEEYEYYKATFARQGDVLTVDVDNIEKVERKTIWVTVDEMNVIINNKDEEIKILNKEKLELIEKNNDISSKVINLGEEINKLQLIENKYNEIIENEEKAKDEKLLNEKIDYFKNKFESLGAGKKFESEEVQNLLTNCIKDKDSLFALNQMLVELVDDRDDKKAYKKTEKVSVIKDLIPLDDIEEKYGFK